ncbi:MAG: restriction endonuclease subunit S [Parcubacteria group bacterium]|nr:restriction endonuclease subunit S [Parcubacteria group bacterium]
MKTDTQQQNIPNGWQLKKLSDVLDYERPDKYIVKSKSYSNKEKTPVLTANKSFVLGYTDEDFGIYRNLPAIIFDDFTTDSKLVNFPFKIKSSAIKILKEKNKDIDLRFVFEKMKSVTFPTGSHKRFYISQYQNLEIAVPPIKEQQKIAEILGAVDEDITKTQEVIEATEKLKRGLMQQLFTHGISHTKFKETKIGQIPESWSMVSVSEVVKKIVDNRGKTPPLASDGIGIIEVNAIDSSQKYPNYLKISKYVSQETYNSWFRSGHPEKGDILIPTVGTVGVAVIMNENKGCIAQNIIAVRVKDTILPDFFYYLVISPLFVDQIRKVLMGAVQPSLKVPHMLAFNIPLPAKPEQQKITEIFSAVDEKISVNKKLKEKLTLLKKGLMQDLLSGKVRINI